MSVQDGPSQGERQLDPAILRHAESPSRPPVVAGAPDHSAGASDSDGDYARIWSSRKARMSAVSSLRCSLVEPGPCPARVLTRKRTGRPEMVAACHRAA